MNADKLWHQYNNFRKRKVAQHAPPVYKALQAQVTHYTTTRDLVHLPTQPLHNALQHLYKETGRQWAFKTYYSILKDAGVKHSTPVLRIKANGAIGLNEEFIQAITDFFNVDLFNTVTNITETTRQFLKDQTAAGIDQGLSLDDIINNLTTSDITKMRAALIARTETMKAANAAEQVGSDRTGLATEKEWIAVRDNRTRIDHADVDGKLAPDGTAFNVGGFKMDRPGDTRAPAREVCNCRCCIGRHVMEDADGLPVRKTDSLDASGRIVM
ncbi:MAG TPA: phage minor head protein [Chitinophagaceae bacterium]